METESRKRPYVGSDEDGNIHVKKRTAVASPDGSPQRVNGAEEPTETDNLELFRKEAIFRRMKHYSRENGRNQAKIAELERRKGTCEAGLAAITACWTQLVEAIRLLVRPEDLPPFDLKTREMFDMSVHVSGSGDGEPPTQPPSGLVPVLEDNMNATQTLLARFIQLGGQSTSFLLRDDTYLSCQRAQTECIALRSQMDLMRVKLRDAVAEKESLHTALVAAQSRADRLQSETVLAMQARAAVRKREEEQQKGKQQQEPKEEESSSEEPQRKLPSSPEPVAAPPNGSSLHDSPESEDWQEIAKVKEDKIVELEHENAILRDEKNLLMIELKSPSPTFISDTPQYKILLDHASRLEHVISENREKVRSLSEQLDQFRKSRREFEDRVEDVFGHANQELKSVLAKRDAENLRLRDQREQQSSELVERKQKDSVKMASLQELKALAESRSERILVLQSELTRCKTRLAADAGNEDLMSFFLKGSTDDASYIEDLKNRLAAAENRVAALEQSLSNLGDRNSVNAEIEVRQQLADATRKLELHQSYYGDAVDVPPDVQQLSSQLRIKEEELQKLRLIETQRAQAETSLYAELDKLSAAWEALDRQVKSKVFDLMAMEERLTKSSHEKAKADNKFFAAMRDKEAIDVERKNISRNLEKQAKVIEKLSASEKNLLTQVADLERELTITRDVVETHKHKYIMCEHESMDWKQRAGTEQTRGQEFRSRWQEREKFFAQKNAELRRAEDAILRTKKDLERQTSKLKVANSGSASQREAALMEEVDKVMLVIKCSTCRQRMRSHVITKCMHFFCKECVDTRIATRQRKCPYCNITFAQSEVQQVFFQ